MQLPRNSTNPSNSTFNANPNSDSSSSSSSSSYDATAAAYVSLGSTVTNIGIFALFIVILLSVCVAGSICCHRRHRLELKPEELEEIQREIDEWESRGEMPPPQYQPGDQYPQHRYSQQNPASSYGGYNYDSRNEWGGRNSVGPFNTSKFRQH